MASSVVLKLACPVLVLIMVLGAAPKAWAAVSCQLVLNDLSPCLSYVYSGGAIVPQNCCGGVSNLNAAAQTSQDRKSVCLCVKQMSRGVTISRAMISNAAKIPAACGVNLPYKIDPNTDCKQIK